MPPANRNQPTRAASSESSYSLMEFMREFPDDAACLQWLWLERCSEDGEHAECPKCKRVRKFHKVSNRPAWDCDTCGYHMHPTAGTIFHKSSTSLQLWFFAMHLITSTRGGISAKQLERELGVTYKTAWRMFNLIRNELMTQDDHRPLSGEVEADETYFGGKPRAAEIRRNKAAARPQQAARLARTDRKIGVFGAVERDGQVRATVIPDSSSATLGRELHRYVLPAATLFTDEWRGYMQPGQRYAGHHRIRHRDNVYVSGNVHTNTIEGFFGNTKRGISGVYHSVSRKWLQGYLNEYAWRYNHRSDRTPMFLTLLSRAADDVA